MKLTTDINLDDSIVTNAQKLGEAAKAYAYTNGLSVNKMVELIVTDILGHAWIDTELEGTLIRSLADLLNCSVSGGEKDAEDDDCDDDSYEESTDT